MVLLWTEAEDMALNELNTVRKSHWVWISRQMLERKITDRHYTPVSCRLRWASKFRDAPQNAIPNEGSLQYDFSFAENFNRDVFKLGFAETCQCCPSIDVVFQRYPARLTVRWHRRRLACMMI